MNATPQSEKIELRDRIRAAVKQMPPAERTAASMQARVLLERQELWRNAKSILFYAPLPEELDIWQMLLDALAAGKTVALPRFASAKKGYVACEIQEISRDVAAGKYGIREPQAACVEIPLNRLDLILVPGVAFDLEGRRLGRGKGHYDQLLAADSCPTCGVAFDGQIVSQIPVEPHDVHLSCILTPTRWHEVTARARF